MKKLILMGRVAAGKTTPTQALRASSCTTARPSISITTTPSLTPPGEYTEVHALGAALAVYSYEADVVGIVISANEPFCVFPPGCAAMVNRDVIGIVTGIDKPDANVPQATRWLGLRVPPDILHQLLHRSGLSDIMDYLRAGDAPAQLQTASPEDSASCNTPKGQGTPW